MEGNQVPKNVTFRVWALDQGHNNRIVSKDTFNATMKIMAVGSWKTTERMKKKKTKTKK